MARRLLAQGEEIERPGRGEEDGERERQVDAEQQHRVPRRARQPAPQPQEGVSQLRGVRQRHDRGRSEEHTSELQSQSNLVCRLLLEKKKKKNKHISCTNATSQPMRR